MESATGAEKAVPFFHLSAVQTERARAAWKRKNLHYLSEMPVGIYQKKLGRIVCLDISMSTGKG